MGKSCFFVGINIEYENISISVDTGGGGGGRLESVIVKIQDNEKVFLVPYPQPLTGSKLKTGQFS